MVVKILDQWFLVEFGQVVKYKILLEYIRSRFRSYVWLMCPAPWYNHWHYPWRSTERRWVVSNESRCLCSLRSSQVVYAWCASEWVTLWTPGRATCCYTYSAGYFKKVRNIQVAKGGGSDVSLSPRVHHHRYSLKSVQTCRSSRSPDLQRTVVGVTG